MFTTKRRIGSFILLFSAVAAFGLPAMAQSKAPAKIQAALFMKVLGFYTNLGGDPFTIHVVGAPDVAAALKTFVGKKAGKATLKEVTEGSGPPSGKAQVVYVGSDAKNITAYCQSNKILSITGIPKFVSEGVTLGVGVENKKPKILLNLSSTKSEDVNWNPAILKVASTIE